MRLVYDLSVKNINFLFISDIHLSNRKAIFKDGRKEFITKSNDTDLNLMHETIIKNWNEVVTKEDVVFYLGDLGLNDYMKEGLDEEKFIEIREIVNRLNGTIHFVMGNHDRLPEIQQLDRFESISDIVDLVLIDGKIRHNFTLCHYPMLSWNKSHYGAILCHGHEHGALNNTEYHKKCRIFDVGCNVWNYTPVDYKTILELCNGRQVGRHH